MIWIYRTRNDSFYACLIEPATYIRSSPGLVRKIWWFCSTFSFRISAEVHDLQLQQAPLGGRPCPEAAQSHVPYGTLKARLVQKWRNGFRTSHLHPSVFWFLHSMATAQAKLRGNIEQALRLLGILSVSSAFQNRKFQNRKQMNCLRQRNIYLKAILKNMQCPSQGRSAKLCSGGTTGTFSQKSHFWKSQKSHKESTPKQYAEMYLHGSARCAASMSWKPCRQRPCAWRQSGAFFHKNNGILIGLLEIVFMSFRCSCSCLQSQDSRHRADIDALRDKQNVALEA